MGIYSHLTKDQVIQKWGQFVKNEIAVGASRDKLYRSLNKMGLDQSQIDLLLPVDLVREQSDQLDQELKKLIHSSAKSQSSAATSIGVAGSYLKKVAIIQMFSFIVPLGLLIVPNGHTAQETAENLQITYYVVGGSIMLLMILAAVFVYEAGANLGAAEDELSDQFNS